LPGSAQGWFLAVSVGQKPFNAEAAKELPQRTPSEATLCEH
jgi:hypothetical protein